MITSESRELYIFSRQTISRKASKNFFACSSRGDEALISSLVKSQSLVTSAATIIRKRSAAFSLLELLITLALMFVLAVMLAGRGSRSRQQKDLLNCEKNLKTIYTALTIYAADNRDTFPIVAGAKTSEEPLSLLIPRSTTETEIFVCPGTSDKPLPQGESFAKRKISYAYYMGWTKSASDTVPLLSDRQVNENPKKIGEFIFSADGKKAGNNHDKYGGNVLFLSGEVNKCGAKAKNDLTYPKNITLLNPKP